MKANTDRLLDGKGLTLLSVAVFTLLSATMIAPALPGIHAHFAAQPNASLLAKLVLTTTPLFIGLAGPIAGMALVRIGRRRMLVWSVLLAALSGSVCTLLNSLPALLVCRAVLGIATAGMMVSTTTLIGDYYTGAARNRFVGLQSAAMKFGGFAFLLLGGVLAAISWRATFAGHLLTLILLPGVLLFIREPHYAKITITSRAPAPIDLGFTVLVCAIAFAGQVVFFTIPTQVPFLMTDRLNSTPQMIGLAISAATLFGVLTAVAYRWFKARLAYTMICAVAFAATALAFGALTVVGSVAGMFAILAIVGLAYGMLIPNLSAWVLARASVEGRSRAVGALTLALFLGQFASPLVAQPFVLSTGISATLGFVAAACTLIAACLAILHVSHARITLEPAV